MKKKPFYAQIKDLFFGLSLIALIVSCGSFKGSSYFNSDGIYFSESKLISEKPVVQNVERTKKQNEQQVS